MASVSLATKKIQRIRRGTTVAIPDIVMGASALVWQKKACRMFEDTGCLLSR